MRESQQMCYSTTKENKKAIEEYVKLKGMTKSGLIRTATEEFMERNPVIK